MPHYRVFLNGRNFSLKVDDRVQRLGFFTLRVVEAADGVEAERLALEMLRQDRWLTDATLNDRSDPPTIHVVGVRNLSANNFRFGFDEEYLSIRNAASGHHRSTG